MAASERIAESTRSERSRVWYEGFVRAPDGTAGTAFRRRRAHGALEAARALARRIRATVQVYAGTRLAGEFHPDGRWQWY